MTSNPTDNRLNGLQALRFLAATLVVWSHAVDSTQDLGLSARLSAGNLETIGAIGVDIFFVISGCIMASSLNRAADAPSFWRARFIRIAPIYWIFSVFWIEQGLAADGFDAARLAATFLFWPAAHGSYVDPYLTVGWTLCFEILFYFALGLTKFGVRGRWILAAFVAFFFARLIWNTATLQFVGNPIILEFLAGLIIARLPVKRLRWPALVLAVLGFALNLAFGFGEVWHAKVIEDGSLALRRVLIWGTPSALLVIATLGFEPLFQGPAGRALARLGDASYATYLTHLMTNQGLVIVAVLLGMRSGDLFIVLAIALATASGVVAHRLLERPLARALTRPPRLAAA